MVRRRMWLIGLILFSLAAVGGGMMIQAFWLTRPVGSGPAGPLVPREPFTRVWTSRPVVLLGVGDSVTAGFGASSPDRSYFRRLVGNAPGDPDDVQGLHLKRVIPNLKAVNIAVSGSTSLQHLEDQLLPLKPYPREVLGIVVMTTGGNDLIHNYGQTPPHEGAMFGATWEQAQPWIANFEKRLDRMVRLLERAFPGGCRIFLADIYDPTDGIGMA